MRERSRFGWFTGAVASVSLLAGAAAPVVSASEGPAEIEPQTNQVFVIDDPRVEESSGLMTSRMLSGIVYTVNDKGNEPTVYMVDRAGTVVGTVGVENSENTDWESLAPATDVDGVPSIVIGDVGDNELVRDEVFAYIVAEPTEPGTYEAPSELIRMAFPDGPHNAEAILVHPTNGQLYIVTKEPDGGSVYRTRKPLNELRTDRVITLKLHAQFSGYTVSGGDFLPDGRPVLRTARTVRILPSFGNEPEAVLRLPKMPQGESVTVELDGASVLVGTEGRPSPVYRVKLPENLASEEGFDVERVGVTPAEEQDSMVSTTTVALVVAATVLVAAAVVIHRRRKRT